MAKTVVHSNDLAGGGAGGEAGGGGGGILKIGQKKK